MLCGAEVQNDRVQLTLWNPMIPKPICYPISNPTYKPQYPM